MPELPEVETIRVGLKSLIVGFQIKSVVSDNAKSFPNNLGEVEQFLVGAKITDILRRGKMLIINLSNKYSLAIHLKMTGQLVYVNKKKRFGGGHPTDSLVAKLPDKSTRVIFGFMDGSYLYFNDQRKFGWVKLLPTAEIENLPFMQKIGPEPLDNEFTSAQFAERFKRRAKTSIKAALLDQSVVAGVGNIYADESLWGAKIHPSVLVGSLTKADFNRLYNEVRAVLNLSIAEGGSTDRNYVNAKGEKGKYLDFAHVFRREGLPCLRCGTEIIKIRVAGRGTHVCPKCQKLR